MHHDPLWTIRDAATWLDPPISEPQLRAIVRALAIPHAGYRTGTGLPGKPARTWPAAELQALHAALTPWLTSQNNPAS